MEPQELLDIYASGQTYLMTDGPDMYKKWRTGFVTGEMAPQGNYLFTVGTPDNEWDAVELGNELTVKLFTSELTYSNLKLPGDRQKSEPIQPVLRFILLYPVTEQEEALKMMGQPFIDHYVVLSVLLVDDDTYTPIGAAWVGREATMDDLNQLRQIVPQVAAELDKDLDKSTRGFQTAPTIEPHTLELMETFKDHELSRHERRNLVEALQKLPDISFMEALGRLMPWAWAQNQWIATESSLAHRAYDLKEQMPVKDRKQIRRAPWKTSWTLPAPFEPKLILSHSKWCMDVERLLVS